MNQSALFLISKAQLKHFTLSWEELALFVLRGSEGNLGNIMKVKSGLT